MKKPNLKKHLRKRKKEEDRAPLRITNDTVAEHRERILAGGRRFKYPVQYARHKLVINAIIIAFAALVILITVGWWQLYPSQNTSTLFYRVTKILPLPVASVDGTQVNYSDYLVKYRGSIHWLDQNGQLEKSEDSLQHQLDFYKRSVLNDVERDALAAKIAKEKNITVSDTEVNEAIKDGLQASNGTISQDLYNSSLLESYGYSPDEYRLILKHSLLRQKVAYAIDDVASNSVKEVQDGLKQKKATLISVAKKIGPKVQYGESGLVNKTNQDGGLTQAAAQLKSGQFSQPIMSTSGDGYYILELGSSTATQLSYKYIKIPLTAFDEQFAVLIRESKIKEYIDVPKLTNI